MSYTSSNFLADRSRAFLLAAFVSLFARLDAVSRRDLFSLSVLVLLFITTSDIFTPRFALRGTQLENWIKSDQIWRRLNRRRRAFRFHRVRVNNETKDKLELASLKRSVKYVFPFLNRNNLRSVRTLARYFKKSKNRRTCKTRDITDRSDTVTKKSLNKIKHWTRLNNVHMFTLKQRQTMFNVGLYRTRSQPSSTTENDRTTTPNNIKRKLNIFTGR